MKIQFKQGVIELCILNLVKSQPDTGYKIEKTMSSTFRMPEGSIYPLLRQLVNKGYLDSYYIEENDKKKKYFRITELGIKEITKLNTQWHSLTGRVNNLIKED